MSARPTNREINSGPNARSSDARRSLASTICRPSAISVSIVYSNSSNVRRLPGKNCKSSIANNCAPRHFCRKLGNPAAAQRFDKTRRELLGRQIQRRRRRMMPPILLENPAQQMRFAHARRPAQQQRRCQLPPVCRQLRRPKCILVARAHNKIRQARVPTHRRSLCSRRRARPQL